MSQAERQDHVVRAWLARASRLPALRAVAAALAIATTVTGIGTAAASGGSSTQGLITSVTTVAPDSAAAAVLAAARTHLGQKYVYGAAGPSTWDCSGLTSTLWRRIGGVASIPRTAALQQAWATPVPAAQVLPGDLYFLGTPATHVGLVVGAGLVLDASSSQGKVVLRALWTAKDITFGRVPRPTATAVVQPPAGTPTTPVAPVSTPPTGTVTAAPVTTSPVTTSPVAPTPTATTPTLAAGAPPSISSQTAAATFVADAKRLVGDPYEVGGTGPAYDDGALIAAAWYQAEGQTLPLDRNALAARTVPILVTHLRPGDLVIYGTTDVWHVGIYVGKGMMVDASRIRGRVLLRRVFTSPDRRFGRLN